ncbi:MAG: nucleotidyltransferase [Planctomycetes bacterium]|nr:nucleotidyltransferase [Planctomycetota bacterium]
MKGVIIGGLAIAFRGRARTTRDVDAINFLNEDAIPDFIEQGAALSFQPRIPNVLDFVKRSRVLLMVHENTGVEVDLSLGSLPLEYQALKRATKVKVGRLSVPVASTEDLIVLKAVARRVVDKGDIEARLDRATKLDVAYVRQHVDEFAQALETPEMFIEFDQRLGDYEKGRRHRKK